MQTPFNLAAKALSAALLAAAALLPAAAHAQWKPTKPVTIIVPWAAGGATDQVTRLAASELEAGLGEKIVVVNQPGGAGPPRGREPASGGRALAHSMPSSL